MNDDFKVYTVKEVAEMLKVSTKTIYRYIDSGKLKATKLGKSWRITNKHLIDLFENND